MSSIYKRPSKTGKGHTWRAVVRIKGYPVTCKTFERKQEAEDWAQETERRVKQGQFNFETAKQQFTYADLMDRLQADGVLQHHRSFKNIRSQFEYWKQRLGLYALVHITSELLSKERQLLIDSFCAKNNESNASTINRYMATLSSTLSYATKQLRWILENPSTRLLKLKEGAGRDRILNEEEIGRLLAACKESKSHYLYCIVLFALTTGARRGELLGLEWRHVDFSNCTAHLKETKNGRPRSVTLTAPVLGELQRLHSLRDPTKPLVFASRTALGRIDIKKAWMEALRRAYIRPLSKFHLPAKIALFRKDKVSFFSHVPAHCLKKETLSFQKIIDFFKQSEFRKRSIQNYRFHDMRHQFATLAAGMGASNLELATAMGHRTLEMLLRYSNLDTQSTKKYSQQISEMLIPVGVENA